MRETNGQQRQLRLGNPAPVIIGDAVHENDDAVILDVGGQNGGHWLLRCRFWTQSCERAGPHALDQRGFALDESLQ